MALLAVAGVGIATGVVTVSVGTYYFFQTTNKRILVIDDITEGDHVKFSRGMFSHHAIIVNIDRDNNLYTIIHFGGDESSNTPPEIKKETCRFIAGNMIRIRYRYGRLSGRITVERANAILEMQETTNRAIVYNILINNSEHVATWCVTGEARSTQVNLALAPFAPIIIGVGKIYRPY